jgi:hypothetical protein
VVERLCSTHTHTHTHTCITRSTTPLTETRRLADYVSGTNPHHLLLSGAEQSCSTSIAVNSKTWRANKYQVNINRGEVLASACPESRSRLDCNRRRAPTRSPKTESEALEPVDAGVRFWLSGDTKHCYPPTKVQQNPDELAAVPTRQLCSPYKTRTVAFEMTVFGSNVRFSARVGKNFLFTTSTLSSDGQLSGDGHSPIGEGSCSDKAGKRQVATVLAWA